MNKQKQINFILSICIFGLLIACERDILTDEETTTETSLTDESENIDSHDSSTDYAWDDSEVVTITLTGSTAESNGTGITITNNTITITQSGTYSFNGTLDEGKIEVNTEDESLVRLILNGVNITNTTNSAILITSSEKTMLVLADDTNNTINDGSSYDSSDEDANAAIFSKSDLTIYGNGSLTVNGNYQDGITSKDGLIITANNITVNATDDGIRGKDYLIINSGTITINAGGDGLKSDNTEDDGKGYITINEGTFNITSDGDAIYAGKDFLISDGTLNLVSGGGSNGSMGYDDSAKGIKTGLSSQFYGGTITINAADDAIHSDGEIEINKGTFYIASADDAIHSDYNTTINDGDIFVTEAYEGIESAEGSINILDGYISIISSDDGINISAGGSSQSGGQRKSTTVTSSDYALNISGGYIYIDCEGDGLDSNDEMIITGGTQIVNGPQADNNSALDYDGTCTVNGGTLLAIGSSKMAQAPGSASSQYSFLVNFSSKLSNNQLIHVQDSEGNSILTYQPHKTFQSIVLSSPLLESGTTYQLYVGGSATGDETNGLYDSETYSGGELYTEFTLSSTVTSIN